MSIDNSGDTPADDTYERGVAMVTEIYQGEVPALPEGTTAFHDVMMRSLFAEVWDRDVLSIRDRRLLIVGVIAARGSTDVWRLQAQSALERGEMTPDQPRETLIALALERARGTRRADSRPVAGDPDRAGPLRRVPRRGAPDRSLRGRRQRMDRSPGLILALDRIDCCEVLVPVQGPSGLSQRSTRQC